MGSELQENSKNILICNVININQNEKIKDALKQYEKSGGHLSRGLLERMGPGWLLRLIMGIGMLGFSPIVQRRNNP